MDPDAYCDTLKKLRRAIHNHRHRMLSNGVVFSHDNAQPLAAIKIIAAILIFIKYIRNLKSFTFTHNCCRNMI